MDFPTIIKSSPTFDATQTIPSLQFIVMEQILRDHPEKSNDDRFYRFHKHQALRNEMIDVIFVFMRERSHEGYIFGGYLRDQYANLKFNDIDIRFPSLPYAEMFIGDIISVFDILIVKKHYIGCFSIRVQSHTNRKICVDLDVTFKYPGLVERFDFDVNMLKSSKPNETLSLMNDKCNLHSVLRNIAKKEFVVLDYYGAPTINHESNFTANFDCHGKVCGFTNKGSVGIDCIYRGTRHGNKLLERIAKMEARGWKCTNKLCNNPTCILSKPGLKEAYNEYKRLEELKRQQKIAARKQKQEVRRFMFRCHIPGRITGKQANTINFEKSCKSCTIDSSKSIKETKPKKVQKVKHTNEFKQCKPTIKSNGRSKIGSKANRMEPFDAFELGLDSWLYFEYEIEDESAYDIWDWYDNEDCMEYQPNDNSLDMYLSF